MFRFLKSYYVWIIRYFYNVIDRVNVRIFFKIEVYFNILVLLYLLFGYFLFFLDYIIIILKDF